jgi:hypothetical protein
MRLLTSTTIFLAALTLASAAYAQDGARAYDPNQLPSYRGQVQFFTLTPPGDIDAPPGPKGQLRAPSPPAPSADAGPPPPPGGSDAGPPPPPPPGPGDQADNAGGPPPSPPQAGRRQPRPPPPPSPAAHFRFARGDDLIDIKFADPEPMRACADAALQLFDRLRPPRP